MQRSEAERCRYWTPPSGRVGATTRAFSSMRGQIRRYTGQPQEKTRLTFSARRENEARASDELRPQKFFIGLMDFFSILLPGALLTYLLMGEVGPVVLGERYAKLDRACERNGVHSRALTKSG